MLKQSVLFTVFCSSFKQVYCFRSLRLTCNSAPVTVALVWIRGGVILRMRTDCNHSLGRVSEKMQALGTIVLLSVALGVCRCANVKNATLVMLPDAVSDVRSSYQSLSWQSLICLARVQGAVCLDGSPPGYYLRSAPAGGVSTKKWILHLGGGGWCGNSSNCYNRSMTSLGSSKSWPASTALNGFLSDNQSVNPSFYDWNIVYLMYCDGSSFTSNVWVNTVDIDKCVNIIIILFCDNYCSDFQCSMPHNV